MWGRQRARIAPVLLGSLVAVGASGTAQAAITISGANAPVDEGSTTNVTVTRDSGFAAATVTVRLSGTGDAPADCPLDASVTAGKTCATTVSFDALQLVPVSRTVPVALAADGLDELDEKLKVEALEGDAVVATKQLSIRDIDAPPTLSIGDAKSVVEGDAAGAVLAFPLTLSAPSSFPVTAKVALGGTATPNGDVVPRGFTDTVTIPAGTRTTSLDLAVAPDDVDEPDEEATVTLTLGPASNATAGAALTAKGTVLNDDVPVVSIADVVGNEGTGPDRTPFAFAVTLSNPSTRTVAVSANSADLQATAGQDYDAVAERLTFAPGVTTQTVVSGVIADAVREDPEAFVVNLSDPSGVVLGRASAFGGISDDDQATTGAVSPAGGVVLPAASTGGRGSTSTGTTTGKLRLSKLAFARPGTLSGKLECPLASRGCKGRITVFSVPQRKSKVKALRKELKLGTITFDVAAGRAQTLKLKLSKKTLATIRRGRKVDVRAYAVSRTPGGEVSTAAAKGVVKP